MTQTSVQTIDSSTVFRTLFVAVVALSVLLTFGMGAAMAQDGDDPADDPVDDPGDDPVDDPGDDEEGEEISVVREAGITLTEWLGLLLLVFAPANLVYAGIQLLAGGKSVERGEQAKLRVMYSVVALVLAAIAFAFVSGLESGLGIPTPGATVAAIGDLFINTVGILPF